MAAYAGRYREVKCAKCGHYIRRGTICSFCGDNDAAANIRETGLERGIQRVEDYWARQKKLTKVGVGVFALVLVVIYFYTAFKAH